MQIECKIDVEIKIERDIGRDIKIKIDIAMEKEKEIYCHLQGRGHVFSGLSGQ
jgi:hypothetical protein